MAESERRVKFPYETIPGKMSYETIWQSERDSSPSRPVYKKRTARDKLGTYNLVVLILGTAAILFAVAFLSFLWIVAVFEVFPPSGISRVDMPPLWKYIVGNTLVPRVVTLSAILIRTATAGQLCVFAAIMAALILERVGASARDFPLLSMIRCANAGPQALILNVFRTLKKGNQLGYSALIVLMILNAVALQFTSTILLGDVFQYPVLMNDTTPGDFFYGLSDNATRDSKVNTFTGVDFWKTGPQIYPRYAEYTGEASNGTNFTDTGKTYRGFLPFTDGTLRSSLRAYTGPMEVIDARVVCVKPILSDLVLWNYTAGYEYIISGNLSIDGVYPSALTTKASNASQQHLVRSDFNCSAPRITPDNGVTYGNASICVLGTGYAKLLDGIIPEPDSNNYPLGQTLAMLLINGTNVDPNYAPVAHGNITLQQQTSSAPAWATFGTQNMTFDMSYCFFNPRPQDYKVTAHSRSDGSDAYAYPDDLPGVNRLNTSFVEYALDGVTNQSTAEQRGQMTLLPGGPENSWTNSTASQFYKTPTASVILDSLVIYDDPYFGISYQFSPFVQLHEAMHRSHADLTSKFLRKSDNPALALQSLWTVLLSMAYYDFADVYDAHANGTFGASEVVVIPGDFYFFYIVIGLLSLHFTLLTISVVLFLTRTEMSLLGNSWQAVSQVMSTYTADTVHRGAMYTDDEVQRTTHAAVDGRIVIARSETTGRTEAVALVRKP